MAKVEGWFVAVVAVVKIELVAEVLLVLDVLILLPLLLLLPLLALRLAACGALVISKWLLVVVVVLALAAEVDWLGRFERLAASLMRSNSVSSLTGSGVTKNLIECDI